MPSFSEFGPLDPPRALEWTMSMTDASSIASCDPTCSDHASCSAHVPVDNFYRSRVTDSPEEDAVISRAASGVHRSVFEPSAVTPASIAVSLWLRGSLLRVKQFKSRE
jgi:hypothetical protein